MLPGMQVNRLGGCGSVVGGKDVGEMGAGVVGSGDGGGHLVPGLQLGGVGGIGSAVLGFVGGR